MADDIHIVEQGDSWEVRRVGDSMPLGTYLTLGEAEEHAGAQAAEDGVRVVEHERDVELDPADVAPPTEAAP